MLGIVHPTAHLPIQQDEHEVAPTMEQLPPVQIFYPDSPIEEIIEAMKVTGGCIIKNFVTEEDADEMEKELRPALDADIPWKGEFFPEQTRRCYALLGQSPTFAKKAFMHPLYQGVCDKFLTTKNWFWSGHKKVWATSKPQIMNSITFSIGPGAFAQPLHRDDWAYHVVAQKADKYPEDCQRDTGIGLFVAGKPSTKENGCTRFIPGSHLWSHETEPVDELCSYATLDKGDAFIMFASCYHGGGANTTKDQERLLFSCFMTRGWLRQEENQYLSIDKEVMKTLPVEIQEKAGYSLSQPFLGWVASTDPRVALDPMIKGNEDMLEEEN